MKAAYPDKAGFLRVAGLCVSILLCILVTASAWAQGGSGSKNFFWSLFIKGNLQGNLQIKSDNTSFVLSGDSYHLVLARPGESILRYTFSLDRVPTEYYILNDWKSHPSRAMVRIKVNGTELSTICIGCNRYISQGFAISHLVRQGENSVEIELVPGAEQLWIRGTLFSENPSLARNVELLPNLLPAYAKTFAIILLVLGLLYLVWFFFNRTLYKNMDTYSASFALIGIMITCLGTAYCVVLSVTRMIWTSVTFLVLTIVMALLAMVSVRRSDSRSGGDVSVEGLSTQEEKVSGSDFNF